MNYEELKQEIARVKEKLSNCKSYKAWKDTKKYYDRLLKEKRDYERFRNQNK